MFAKLGCLALRARRTESEVGKLGQGAIRARTIRARGCQSSGRIGERGSELGNSDPTIAQNGLFLADIFYMGPTFRALKSEHLLGICARFVDFELVRIEIEQETIRRCGGGLAISTQPIILEIVGSGRPPLTLIDLPGLTRVAIDQPDNIVGDIERMVKSYVGMRDNCIILAVSQANADLAGSEGLRMAREVDPTGQRTIGELLAATTEAVADTAGRLQQNPVEMESS